MLAVSSRFIFTGLIAGLLIVVAAIAGIMRSQPETSALGTSLEQIEGSRNFLASFSNVESLEDPETVSDSSVIYNSKEQAVPLGSFVGKVVVLNFWATWCAPCVAELQSLAQLHEKRSDIAVLAVSRDLHRKPGELKDFLENKEAGALEVYYNQGIDLDRQFPTRGLPTTYIIRADGKIAYKLEGDADWASQEAFDFIDFVIQEN